MDGFGQDLGLGRGLGGGQGDGGEAVMNMMRRPGWRAAATRATSIPSAPGMTMSVSSRS